MSNKQALVDILNSTNGKIFRVTFIKKTTGELRHLNGRLHVHKGVKGVGLNFSPSEHNLMTVFDLKKKEFRMINLDGLKEVKFRKQVHKLTE